MPMRTLAFGFVLLMLVGCARPQPEVTIVVTPGAGVLPPPTPPVTPWGAGAALPNPTPDPARVAAGGNYQVHTVSAGETLTNIAERYGSTVDELLTINSMGLDDFLYVGQSVLVPGGANAIGSNFKVIPDSEVVYGPAAVGFDVTAAAAPYGGFLLGYSEEVEGQRLSGPAILQLVADRYSVNPRLLLAALEFRSGWVTRPGGVEEKYPMGYIRERYEGLYVQLGWAANLLNGGYYGRAEGGVNGVALNDGTWVAFAPDINDGTAGVQKWLAGHTGATVQGWLAEAGPSGFFATYNQLFGNPFAYAVEPLWPADLQQPPLRLPWAAGQTWYFTGGPHGGWAGGSGWAALDFVPGPEQLGCYESGDWVTAVAGGVVTRSGFGAVVVDLDGDGFVGTGWAVTHMHLATADRVAEGTVVAAGDPLGHPSCEGGFSNGTHLHLSRTYNGRWVSADGAIPFQLGGWVSQGFGNEYDGLLVREGEVKEACQCREALNAITAEGD